MAATSKSYDRDKYQHLEVYFGDRVPNLDPRKALRAFAYAENRGPFWKTTRIQMEIAKLYDSIQGLEIMQLPLRLEMRIDKMEAKLPKNVADPDYDAGQHLIDNLEATCAKLDVPVEELWRIWENCDMMINDSELDN
ncbi:MAG: hypothetical protein Q9168_005060 [Polycauliona sp. 1 TL-2023]